MDAVFFGWSAKPLIQNAAFLKLLNKTNPAGSGVRDEKGQQRRLAEVQLLVVAEVKKQVEIPHLGGQVAERAQTPEEQQGRDGSSAIFHDKVGRGVQVSWLAAKIIRPGCKNVMQA